MGDDLSKIPYVLGLGRRTRRTLTINLAIAFGAIALMVGTILLRGIPLPTRSDRSRRLDSPRLAERTTVTRLSWVSAEQEAEDRGRQRGRVNCR